MNPPILGKALWASLPDEIRDKFPPRVKRFVIDVSLDGPVRVLYETHGPSDEAPPLVEAILKADVEIVEATHSIVELPEDATLVLHVPGRVSQEGYKHICEHLQEAFNHTRVAVLQGGASLEVVLPVGKADPE